MLSNTNSLNILAIFSPYFHNKCIETREENYYFDIRDVTYGRVCFTAVGTPSQNKIIGH